MGRSSPKDKYRLVGLLMEAGEVVAVTGDGSNDSPALKRANVGLSMGKCGTELAKMASDIIILDDNFSSIVSALKWGRCIYDNIRAFLLFELVVNFSAIGLSFVSAIVLGHSPLKPIQVLYLNILNEPLGAIAFSSIKPTESLLDRAPYGITESVVNWVMVRNITGATLYRLAALFIFLFAFKPIFGFEDEDLRDSTCFNIFMFCEIMNIVNCRTTSLKGNPYDKILKNKVFLAVIFALILLQVIVIQFCGTVFHTTVLHWEQWLASIGCGIGSLLSGFVIRLIPVPDKTTENLTNLRNERRKAIENKYQGMSVEEMWATDSDDNPPQKEMSIK